MKKILLILCFSVVALIGGEFEDGIEAIKSKDYEKAKSALQSACDEENARACSVLGDLYSGQIEEVKELKKSLLYYKKGCDLKDVKSCYNLAYMYRLGEGVDIDINESISYFSKGCHGGDGMSCYELSDIYEEQGDDKKALNLQVRACDLGCTKSCSYLAKKYMKKDNQDVSKAIHFASKACNKNDADSCQLLGLIYGAREDYVNGGKFLSLACVLKSANSCYALSFLYAKGQGFKQDMNSSKQYAKKSCDLGYKEGCKLFEDLEKALKEEEK